VSSNFKREHTTFVFPFEDEGDVPHWMVKPLRIRNLTLLYAASSPKADSSAVIISSETPRIRIRRSPL